MVYQRDNSLFVDTGVLSAVKLQTLETLWRVSQAWRHLGPTAMRNVIVPTCEDERQITHLICARLKYDLYDFLGGVLGLLPFCFLYKRPPKHPLKKSYRSYFRRAQIR